MNAKSLFDEIVHEIPGFKHDYHEHIKDYGELLPHVLMGDFTRFVIDRFRKESQAENVSEKNLDVTRRSLEILERAVSSADTELQELVSVSFLENLHQAEDDYDAIRAFLRPGLKHQLVIYESVS